MRRGLTLTTLIILTVLTTPTMVAAADQVLDEWLFWDGSTTVDGESVNVLLADDNTMLRVSFLNESTVIPEDSCRDIDVYAFCFEDKSNDEKPDIDSDGQLRPGVNLVVEKYDITTKTDTGTPEMDIDVDAPDLDYGSDYDIDVTFENDGDGAMFNFSATVRPHNLTHEANGEDIVTVGNAAYRVNGGIEADGNKSLPLTVGLDGMNPWLRITYEYDVSDNDTSITGSENITLDTEKFYDVSLDAPSQAKLYTENIITVTVQNNASNKMTAAVDLTHTGNQLFKSDENTDLSIKPDETQSIEATYIPRYEGTGEITANTSLDWGLQAAETRNTTIITSAPDVDVSGQIERTLAGEDTKVNITIDNNDSVMLYQPTATIRTPFGDEVRILADNITYDTREAYSLPLKIPLGLEPQSYDAQIIVRYTTKSDERFKHEIDNSFVIDPVAYDVQIEKTFSDQTPSLNETVHVEVYAENIGIEAFNDLTIKETTSPNVYQNTLDVDLDPDARKRLYEYNVSYNGTPVTTTTRTNDDRITMINTKTIDGEAPPQQRQNKTPVLPGDRNETATAPDPSPNPQRQNQTEQDEQDSAPDRILSFLNEITATLEDFFASLG